MWDGTSWFPLGAGIDGFCFAITVDQNGMVYAGGEFELVGAGVGANNIAKWDGQSWLPLGQGIEGNDAACVALAVDQNNNLFVGGEFTMINGVLANSIARWDGSSWSSLDGGLNESVGDNCGAIAIGQSGTVYIGGFFSSAGGVPAEHIASWCGETVSSISSFQNQNELKVYPTPTTDNVYFSSILQEATKVSILDSAGRIIRTVSVTNSKVDFSDLSPGMYFLKLQDNLNIPVIKIIKK